MKKRKVAILSVGIIIVALLLEVSILKCVNDKNAYQTSKVLIDRVSTVLNKNDESLTMCQDVTPNTSEGKAMK